MLFQQLTLSYECLSSIGNSLEIESMISEVLITFSRKTGAVSGSYYSQMKTKEPLVHIGKKIDFDINDYEITKKDYEVFLGENKQVVILLLKHGYLLLIYKNKEETVDKLAAILGNFQYKINLSISACEGVTQLETLNEKLEERVSESVKKIRENEKLLISQSKQAVMGEMIEMIAHQWRQPITSIGMISNNILFDIVLDELDKDSLKDELDKINKQVMFLSNTIDDFRDFFKESKEKQEVSVADIIHGTMSIIDKQLEKHSIEVNIQNSVEDLSFFTFKNELIQVLLNILGNAKDAFEEKKIEYRKVTILCEKQDSSLIFCIEDNAGGVSDTIIDKIFEPYFSTKKKKNGTGLGLYMSMIIVTEHLNGKILVENKNNGATFKVSIPLEEGEGYE